MIRVLGATGRLFEAAMVLPIVETTIAFNGNVQYKLEVARSMNESPTGLVFLRDSGELNATFSISWSAIEYIGNIPTDKVREALSHLLTEGFYNFSEWDYQKERELKKTVLDNGSGHPYSSAITENFDYGIIKPLMRNVPENSGCCEIDEEWYHEDVWSSVKFC